MKRLNLVAGAMASVLTAGVASAADMPVYYEQPVQAEFGGWYLRGYGGVSKQVVDKFEPRVSGVPDTSITVVDKEFDFAGLVGLGAGYDFGNGFRFDVTAERRLSSSFDGRDTWNSGLGENNYIGKKDEWLFLANGYWEFYEAGNFKPFIGAGVGAVHLKLSDFGDIGPGPYAPPDPDAWGFAPSSSSWNFAGALYAGFGYQLSDNWTFDLNYRFLYLGDITSGLLSNPATLVPTIDAKFHDVMSHDVMFGLRYTFN